MSRAIWWPLCAVFFVGLANFRRPLSLRNLDLLVLALVQRVVVVLQRRRDLHVGAAGVSASLYLLCANGAARWRGRGTRPRRRSGRCGSSSRRRSSRGLPDRTQSRCVERHRRRLRERHRRAADRGEDRDPVRPLPGAETATSAGRAMPTATSVTGSRRTAVASRRSTAAISTARSPTSLTSPGISRRAGAASGTTFPPPTSRRSLFDLVHARSASLSSDCRFGGARLAATLRLRVGRLPVHALTCRARTRTTRSCRRCSCGASGS